MEIYLVSLLPPSVPKSPIEGRGRLFDPPSPSSYPLANYESNGRISSIIPNPIYMEHSTQNKPPFGGQINHLFVADWDDYDCFYIFLYIFLNLVNSYLHTVEGTGIICPK